MAVLVLRRLLSLGPTLLGITFVLFLALALLPGDPARLMLGDRARPEALAELRLELGLDRPFLTRYFLFLGELLRGNLGRSFVSNRLVTSELAEHFPATLELTLGAMCFALVGGIGLGLFAATRAGRLGDVLSMSLAVAGVSMPIFLLALLLMLTFSLWLPEWLPWLADWRLPSAGRMAAETDLPFSTRFYLLESLLRGRWVLAGEALRHLLLPSIALGTIPLSVLARMTRASVLEVLGEDYIRTARAKGLPEWLVVVRHALANALMPVITVAGLQVGALLGGAVITERVFAWPGIGSWLLNAVLARDIRVVQGGVLCVACCFVLVNLIADLLYLVVNPRLR